MTYNDVVLKQRVTGRWERVSTEPQYNSQLATDVALSQPVAIAYPTPVQTGTATSIDTNVIIFVVLGLIAGLVLANTIYNSKCKC